MDSLRDLRDTLNAIGEVGGTWNGLDLPTFGGTRPETDKEVVSWDETHMLVCSMQLHPYCEIVPRPGGST